MAANKDLEAMLEIAQSFFASKGISSFLGSWEEHGSLPVLSVDSEELPDLQLALKAADVCQPRLAIVYSGRLTREEWEAAKANVETLENEKERGETLEALKAIKSEIGNLAKVVVEILCANPAILITFSAYSDWNESFYDLIPEDDDSDAHDENDEAAELKNLAKELAENTVFQRARNRHEREVLLHKILGERGIKPWQEQRIIDQACAIYRMEILPEKENELRLKAIRLSESGHRVSAIAAKLGIKRSDVQRLLP